MEKSQAKNPVVEGTYPWALFSKLATTQIQGEESSTNVKHVEDTPQNFQRLMYINEIDRLQLHKYTQSFGVYPKTSAYPLLIKD